MRRRRKPHRQAKPRKREARELPDEVEKRLDAQVAERLARSAANRPPSS